MRVTEHFIRRPVMTALITAAMVIFGAFSYYYLPVSDVPNVDFPTIQVSATLPGASPETMASTVATPLEKQLSSIAGIATMSSTSSQGRSEIILQFELDRNIDNAAMDVQSAISKASGSLPPGMPSPPTYQKVNPADQPVIYMALTSQTLPLSQVNEYAQTFLTQRISMISGVSQVLVYGEKLYAVRAKVDPDLLAARGIALDEVAAAIKKGNVNLPTGSLDSAYKSATIKSSGQLLKAEDYRSLVVTYRDGKPVRLFELGEVVDSVSNDKTIAKYNGQPSLVIAVKRQPGSNTIEVVDRIQAALPAIRDSLPASINLNVMYDRSQTIRESVSEVKFTLGLALGLVVMVVFLFLRNISATIITSLALPVSIIATFAVMLKFGFTIDNISLMALTLCVGFVVDDAVVMIENIFRHMEMGKTPMQASLDGAKEVGFTIISMTLSLAAVFLPIMFMSGLIGRILNEFAVTITAAILVSGVVSLTLTPMLCARFLRQKPGGHGHDESGHKLGRFLSLYERSLRFTLKHRFLALILSGLLLVVTGFAFVRMPKGFIPSDDLGYLFGYVMAEQGISYNSMAEHQHALTPIMLADPNVSAVVNVSGIGQSNNGFFFLRLKPHKERALKADKVLESIRPKLWTIPGLMVFIQNPPLINLSGRITKANYQFTLQSPNTTELFIQAQRLEKMLASVTQIQDVSSDLQMRNPQVELTIDRDRASALHVSADQVETALGYAFAGGSVSTIYAANDQYDVILEVLDRYQEDSRHLDKIYIRTTTGALVPLSAVTAKKVGEGPVTISHTGQLPSVTIFFNLKPGVALGDAVKSIQELINQNLPASINANFEGTAAAFKSSMASMLLLIIMALVVIYIILGILYEDFFHPLTILSGLPSAALGGLLTLIVFGHELNLYAMVGVIMLIGIVKKNAIMVVDFAIEAERKEGLAPLEAAVKGSLVRFRPILMTTVAAIMGALPIALGIGGSGEARRPLGLVVVGGLILSQVVTLYLTPVFYLYMHKLKDRKQAMT